MSPFHHWASMHHMHYYRGPSRLIWFVIGAAAATWYHNRAPEFRREWEHCRTVRVLPPVPVKEGETEEERWQRGAYRTERAEGHPHSRFPPWGWERHRNPEPMPAPVVEAQSSKTPVQQPQPQLQPQPQPQAPEHLAPVWPWDSQAADEVMAEMSKRASQTLTELSATLQSFNSKLAEREKERKEMERKREEERLNPPRIV